MSDPLQARKAALQSYGEVLHKKVGVDESLNAQPALSKQDRAFALLLVKTTLQWQGALSALLARYLQSPPKSDYVVDVLMMGAAQILLLDVPPHAAVHTSVELIKQSKFKGFSKLANAVLQRICREGKAAFEEMDKPRLATPDWLWEAWVKDWGEETARRIAAANLTPPTLDITVRENPKEWATTLGGIALEQRSIRITKNADVTKLEGYDAGGWWVQDAAAAMVVPMLGDVRGLRVLDLCAAPGGKTAQLIAAGAEVTAVDRSPQRVKRLKENLARLKMEAKIITANVMEWQPDAPFDAILLDAPCSATGTLRRHPEIAWQKSAKDVTELAGVQRAMLERALAWLSPKGILVYAVCSLEKSEGEAHFVDIPALATRRIFPFEAEEIGGMDGFFMARVERV